MIIQPPCGGYWVQNGEFESSQDKDGIWHAPEISTDHFRVDVDNTALMYGRHFANKVRDPVQYCCNYVHVVNLLPPPFIETSKLRPKRKQAGATSALPDGRRGARLW